MTTSELHLYEVWLMWVEFTDHPSVGKVRPVVITDLESDGLAGIVVKITSNTNYRELLMCCSRIGLKRFSEAFGGSLFARVQVRIHGLEANAGEFDGL